MVQIKAIFGYASYDPGSMLRVEMQKSLQKCITCLECNIGVHRLQIMAFMLQLMLLLLLLHVCCIADAVDVDTAGAVANAFCGRTIQSSSIRSWQVVQLQ